MAAIHAGVKRSYQDMRGIENIPSSPKANSKEVLQQIARSRESSATPTPPKALLKVGTPEPKPRKVAFTSDASIVLIGIRGTGKSSLGFLAASAYSRRLVESDRIFAEIAGSTRTVYRKLQGPAEYHRKHCEVLGRLLESNKTGCVIVCSFSDLESDGAKLIEDYAQTHPVIYVTRDVPGIQHYIKVWQEDRIQDLIRASEPLLRECTNYEFFNVSESLDRAPSLDDASRLASARTSNGPFLTLKRTEHDFLQLLRNIIGDHDRARSHQSAYPLSKMSVEELEFTSAVRLTADDVVSHRIDTEEAQIGVDGIQLEVSTSPKQGGVWKLGKHSCFSLVSEAFAILRRSTILPIIIAITKDDRQENQKQITRQELLDYCLRLGPEYCTVDLRLEDSQLKNLLASRGRTKIIGEYAAADRLPDGWSGQQCLDVYSRAHELGCDLVKIIMPQGTFADHFAIQALKQRVWTLHNGRGPRLIAYCTGRQGRPSMCFNNILTPVNPATHTPGITTTNEECRLVTARERNQALFSCFIHEPMQFLIYGANVSFSLSPAMHNAAYEACGMLHAYRTHSASTLDDFVALVQEHDFGGAAIVQPFKTKTIPMMDILSPHAKAIGALNTVIPLRDESVVKAITAGNSEVGIFRERNRTGPVIALYGDNTDWIGIRACIRRGLSPANTVRPQTTGLVCGAGGMARAAIYAMISLGVQTVFVVNRTKGNAEELAAHYNHMIRSGGIAELSQSTAATTSVQALESFQSEWPKALRHPTMIVSCVPTQTTDGTPTNFTLPKDWLSSRTGGVVVELAYMPIVTPLVRQVQSFATKGWILMVSFFSFSIHYCYLLPLFTHTHTHTKGKIVYREVLY